MLCNTKFISSVPPGFQTKYIKNKVLFIHILFSIFITNHICFWLKFNIDYKWLSDYILPITSEKLPMCLHHI